MSKFNGPKSGKTIAVMLRIITIFSSDTIMPLMRRIDRCQSSPIKSIKQPEKQTKSFTTDQGSASGSSTHYFCFCCTVPQRVQRAFNDASQIAPVITQLSIQPKRISLKSKREPKISRLQWQQCLYSSSQAQRSHLTSPFIFLLLSLYHACTFPDHNDRWDLSIRLFNHLNIPKLWLLRWLANKLLKHPRVGVSCLILDLLNRSSEKLDSGQYCPSNGTHKLAVINITINAW